MPFRAAALAAILVPALAAAADPAAAVELFEDDTKAILVQLTHGGIAGGEANAASAETADVVSGMAALRVAVTTRSVRATLPVTARSGPSSFRSRPS